MLRREVKTPPPDEVIEILKADNIEPTPDAIRRFYFQWSLGSIMAKFERNAEYQEGHAEDIEDRAETIERICNVMNKLGMSPEEIQKFRETEDLRIVFDGGASNLDS